MGKVEDYDDEVQLDIPEMIFTDRDNPRRVFWNAYDTMGKGEFYVINYFGFGGIGKSRLCGFLNDCLQSGVHPQTQKKLVSKSVILNFEVLKNDCEKVNVLENLANIFENECNYHFPLFKYALYVYYRTKGYSQESPEISRLQDNAIAGTLIDAFELVPVVGGIGSLVMKGIDTLAASMKEKVLKNSDVIKRLDHMSTEDISEELIKLFIKEMREQTQTEAAPVVIFLDTYEQLQNYVYQKSSAKVSEEWLWSRTGVIRRIPNVLWVLAGQRQVDWGKTDSFWRDESNIIYEEISEIKEDDRVKKMLKEIGIAEDEIIDLIVEKTKGVPVHLALCKDTYFNLKAAGKRPALSDFDMDYTQLAKRFIGGLKSQLKDIVDILACLENWTQEDIAKMDFSADSYEYVMQLSFIKKEKDRYGMHKSVQEIVYKDCSPIIRSKCLLYFKKQIQDPDVKISEKKDYILKQMKLRAYMISGNIAEKKETEIKAFIDEIMEHIETYLWDYNFFGKAKSILWDSGLDAYMDEISKKKLDIYRIYHSALIGEYSTVRHYVESGAIYKKAGLDSKTKGLLYFAVGSLENNNQNYRSARQYLVEAYTMLNKSVDKRILKDIIAMLSLVCLNLDRYQEMDYYCRLGIDMVADERMDTDRVLYEAGLYIDKAKAARMQEHYNEALQWLAKTEELLSSFESKEMGEDDRILRRYLIIYWEYYSIYGSRAREDLQKKYLALMLEYAQKAYDSYPSVTNYRNLGISYRDSAKETEDIEKREQYFDKYIRIMRDLYEESANYTSFDELFYSNRVALDYMSGEKAQKYIDTCEDMLQNPKQHTVSWKEAYMYHRALFLYYVRENDWDKAEEKMTQLEQQLEGQKEKLNDEKYWDYLIWNYRQRGALYEHQGQIMDAIRIWEKELLLEKKYYQKDAEDQDARAYAAVCKCLARGYGQCGLTGKAIYYSLERLDAYKKMMKDYAVHIMFQIFDAAMDLCENYVKYRRYDDVIALCKEVNPYMRKAFEETGEENWLLCSTKLLNYMGMALLRQGKPDEVLESYVPFLTICDKGDYEFKTKENETDLQGMVDFLKCRVACILYTKDQELEKARIYLQASQCPYSEFRDDDKELFLGKIEKRILEKSMERVYLTKAEGIALLNN